MSLSVKEAAEALKVSELYIFHLVSVNKLILTPDKKITKESINHLLKVTNQKEI